MIVRILIFDGIVQFTGLLHQLSAYKVLIAFNSLAFLAQAAPLLLSCLLFSAFLLYLGKFAFDLQDPLLVLVINFILGSELID